jgi:hypothetical protein
MSFAFVHDEFCEGYNKSKVATANQRFSHPEQKLHLFVLSPTLCINNNQLLPQISVYFFVSARSECREAVTKDLCIIENQSISLPCFVREV